MNITEIFFKASTISTVANFHRHHAHEPKQVTDGCAELVPAGSVRARANALQPNCLRQYVNLASARLGTQVAYVTDEFFGASERMLADQEPRFYPDAYDDHGKWMDGWESRRKRDPGHDFAVIDLGMPGTVRSVGIDTSYFTGNYPPQLSIESCDATQDAASGHLDCEPLLAKVDLQGDSKHYYWIDADRLVERVKVNLYPDGGIARLKLYGEVPCDLKRLSASAGEVDLLALENGGRARLANNEHYGSMHNLNLPGPSVGMADGWETRRRRTPGNDWVIMSLGAAGRLNRIVVDTAYFKGNSPKSIKIQAQLLKEPPNLTDAQWEEHSAKWPVLLDTSPLRADSNHTFVSELGALGEVSHLRINIIPDGGVARIRAFGEPIK